MDQAEGRDHPGGLEGKGGIDHFKRIGTADIRRWTLIH
jgi:hypothetical protein